MLWYHFKYMVFRTIRFLLPYVLIVGAVTIYLLWAGSHIPFHIIPTPQPTIVWLTPTPTHPPTRLFPLIPYGDYHGPSYSHLARGTMFTDQGVPYELWAGGQGRLWGIAPAGMFVLLYGSQEA